MKELLKTNIYDIEDTIIVIGSCLPSMQPLGFDKLKSISNNIYQVCLEETHLNMIITKISGMLATGKIKNIIFATVDKSPHCVQLHYVRNELDRIKLLKDVNIKNYVVVDNELIEIDEDTISISKNLSRLKNSRMQ